MLGWNTDVVLRYRSGNSMLIECTLEACITGNMDTFVSEKFRLSGPQYQTAS